MEDEEQDANLKNNQKNRLGKRKNPLKEKRKTL